MQLDNVRNPRHAGQTKGAKMEKQIGAFEARRNFGQVIEEAYYHKDAFIVTRAGREMAAIISIDDYRQWRKLAKELAMQMVRAVWERNQEVPVEELEADVEKALQMLRAEEKDAAR
jgi:prevent-host-death family protein